MEQPPIDRVPRLSIEHSPLGTCLPQWLGTHLRGIDGSDGRLIVLHPSSASRKQAILDLSSGQDLSGYTLNPENHQTINSLTELLVADFRISRPFSDDGVLLLLEQEFVSMHAKKMGFPLLHADTTREWPLARTRRLASLHSSLQQAGMLGEWDGDPGAIEFDKILREIETRHNRSHPRLVKRKLIRHLNEMDGIPFTFNNIDGIIMLDHDPTMVELDIEFLKAVSLHVPIHQLIGPGSYRLGHHGALIEDIHPCKISADLPAWVPAHEPQDVDERPTSLHRILLEEGSDEVSTVLSLLDAREGNLNEGRGEKILIVDGDVNRDTSLWHEVLSEAGWSVQSKPSPILELSAIHSLRTMLAMGLGDESWSPERLLSHVNSGFPLSEQWLDVAPHPEHPDWRPRPHPDLLVEVAHGIHIRGGPYALSQWCRALAEPRFEHPWISVEERQKAREETQWWILCTANRLSPWLDEIQQDILTKVSPIGCSSASPLPLPGKSGDMYGWFDGFVEMVDWVELTKTSPPSIGALRNLIEAVQRLEKTIDSTEPLVGRKALEALDCLIDGITQVSLRIEDSLLRVLTPSQALGCDADLLILTGISSSAWPVSSPSVPWMELSDRLALGVERPDSPMRSARHLIRHVLHAANEVVVMDSSITESNPAGTHWAEILDEAGQENRLSWLEPPSYLLQDGEVLAGWKSLQVEEAGCGITPQPLSIVHLEDGGFSMQLKGPRFRDERQAAGLSAIEGGQAEQVTPNAALTRWESQVIEERNSRKPSRPEGEYLNQNEMASLVSSQDLDLLKNWTLPEDVPAPRFNETWPIIGRSHPKKKRTPSVDIRPIRLPSTGVEVLDQRFGFTEVEPIEMRWSASRLHDWLSCPRKGWLKHQLRASEPETFEEDMDGRLRGILVHEVLALTLAEVIGFDIGALNDYEKCPNLAASGRPLEEVMSVALRHALNIAPWLARCDAVASHRRRSMLGLSHEELIEWEDDDEAPIIIGGRLGAMIRREMELTGIGVVCMEWDMVSLNGGRATIEIPPAPEAGDDKWKFSASGRIDRIEVLPQKQGWVREEGKREIMPLDLDIGDEDPSIRHVVIREVKSVEGPEKKDIGKRHKTAILDEVQLALYARSWELSNPGDRVVAVGVSEVGEVTNHLLELDDSVLTDADTNVADIGTELGRLLHRRRGESHSNPKSVPFRAWLRHRLEISGRVVEAASKGQVNPTPSAKMCSYCPVKMSCGLDIAFKGGFS